MCEIEYGSLVLVKLLGHAPDHPASPDVDNLITGTEWRERLDAADDVLFGDSACIEPSKAGYMTDKLVHVDHAAVTSAGADADIDDLDTELVLPVTEAEQLCPPASATGAGEGIDTDGGTHLLEGMTEVGIALDSLAMLGGEAGEGGAEVVEL